MPLPESMIPSDWIEFLAEHLVSDDLEEDTLYALLHYLMDLNLLVPCENKMLSWEGLTKGLKLDEQIQFIQDGFIKVAQTEMGFAIPFFIGFRKVELPAIETLVQTEIKTVTKKNMPELKPASDFSNLQIVKKVGRQLKPFLELESAIVVRLLGEHTGKADARILFQYIFGKLNSKAQPRKWEQLSRKRHR